MFVVENLGLAIALCIATMMGWGSWANTQKLAGNRLPRPGSAHPAPRRRPPGRPDPPHDAKAGTKLNLATQAPTTNTSVAVCIDLDSHGT